MIDSAAARMASYLKRIATGPEMSKDLTREETRDGMEVILCNAVDHVQARSPSSPRFFTDAIFSTAAHSQ